MKRSSLLYVGAAIEAAFAMWNFSDDFSGFRTGAISLFDFARSVVPWAGLSLILFFFARQARMREAGEI